MKITLTPEPVATSRTGLLRRANLGLTQALGRLKGRTAVGPDGRLRRFADNLIPGVDAQTAIAVVGERDAARLRAPESATAMAVNCFVPWRRAPERLVFGAVGGFDLMQVNARCPTGLRGTPPHLGLLAVGSGGVAGVIISVTDYLGRRRSRVSELQEMGGGTTSAEATPWLAEWEASFHDPERYAFLNVGLLAKHAIGLARLFPDRPTRLVYNYWEPLDAGRFEAFARHREEIELLTEAVAGGRVDFFGRSLLDQWAEWGAPHQPAWLIAHVDRLRRRYALALAPST